MGDILRAIWWEARYQTRIGWRLYSRREWVWLIGEADDPGPEYWAAGQPA